MATAGFYVYEHRRLDTGAVFYVGKGSGDRLKSLCGRSRYWRSVAKKAGWEARPVFHTEDEELAFLAEMELIRKHRDAGSPLVNLTDGGEGMSGYSFPPDVIAKRAESQRGQVRPSVSEKLKGRTKSAAHRAALAESKKGTKASKATKEKMSRIRKGRVSTMLGKKHSDESREKTRASLLKLPRKTCPHCGRGNLDPGNAARLHFDRCRSKT